jgi:histone H3/H4
MAKKDLPLVPFERILKQAGAKRVSKSACEAFAEVMADYIFRLSKEAARLAEHAGRKTILDSDVRLARKKVD